ncbi:hypothetical protein F4779DRAFT_411020 [Xylariaceae sp. FL0662B]|nr:hypothetical protein F4779DRAFT_411020 [Xylariaceae sp. FL0662B]
MNILHTTMQRLWGCSGCVRFIGLAIFASETVAKHHDQYRIHQLEKNHDILRHPKRDATCQQADWSLCPASVNGGCCPKNYACDISSCYATTAGPTTACGKTGWYACPLTAGAGVCCPTGMICPSDSNDCLPPAGESYSQSCPASFFGCASSLGYGCCPNGMVCGSGVCYKTTPTTLPVSSTITTTNSNGDTVTTTVTSMAIITPGPDIATMSSADPATAAVPKLIPSTVSKMPSIETGNSDNGGGALTASQLGGIIGGVVALLVAVIVAAVIIIRRLRRTEKAAQAAAESKRESSNSQPPSQKPGFGQSSISEIGTELGRSPDMRPAHLRALSDSSADERSLSRTPNLNGSGTSSPPPWAGRCNPTPPSDGRQSSLDSYGGHHENAQQPIPMRVSVETQASHPYTHSRQHSNTSEVSGSADGAHGVSELDSLDSGEAARRRSNSSTRPSKAHARRNSDPPGHSRAHGDSTAAAAPLGTVNEIAELHGYYGSPSLAVGQTAAWLNRPGSSTSSAPKTDP